MNEIAQQARQPAPNYGGRFARRRSLARQLRGQFTELKDQSMMLAEIDLE